MYYRISPSLPAWAAKVLAETAAANEALLRAHLDKLGRMGSRPGRQQACCGE